MHLLISRPPFLPVAEVTLETESVRARRMLLAEVLRMLCVVVVVECEKEKSRVNRGKRRRWRFRAKVIADPDRDLVHKS